jgi:hypothetical protein
VSYFRKFGNRAQRKNRPPAIHRWAFFLFAFLKKLCYNTWHLDAAEWSLIFIKERKEENGRIGSQGFGAEYWYYCRGKEFVG